MKTKMCKQLTFSFLFLLSVLLPEVILASSGESDACHLTVTTTPSTQRGGRYITASGTLNVLFIYVQFPDDNWLPGNGNWPKGQAPAFMNATIDSVWSATPTQGGGYRLF